MDSVLRWQDATVGVDSKVVGVRMTDEEKERLEEMRRSMGLTSKAQVVRVALDLLELASRPGRWAFDSPEKYARESAEWPLEATSGFARSRLGSPTSSSFLSRLVQVQVRHSMTKLH